MQMKIEEYKMDTQMRAEEIVGVSAFFFRSNLIFLVRP